MNFDGEPFDRTKTFTDSTSRRDESLVGYVSDIDYIGGTPTHGILRLHDVVVDGRFRTRGGDALVRLVLIYTRTRHEDLVALGGAFCDHFFGMENPLVTTPVVDGVVLMDKVFYIEPGSVQHFVSRYIRTDVYFYYERFNWEDLVAHNTQGSLYLAFITDAEVTAEVINIRMRGEWVFLRFF